VSVPHRNSGPTKDCHV